MFSINDVRGIEDETIEFLRKEVRAIMERRREERDEGKPLRGTDLAVIRLLFRLIADQRKREAETPTESELFIRAKTQDIGSRSAAITGAGNSSNGSGGSHGTGSSESTSGTSLGANKCTSSSAHATPPVSAATLATTPATTNGGLTEGSNKEPSDQPIKQLIDIARQPANIPYEHKKHGKGQPVPSARG